MIHKAALKGCGWKPRACGAPENWASAPGDERFAIFLSASPDASNKLSLSG